MRLDSSRRREESVLDFRRPAVEHIIAQWHTGAFLPRKLLRSASLSLSLSPPQVFLPLPFPLSPGTSISGSPLQISPFVFPLRLSLPPFRLCISVPLSPSPHVFLPLLCYHCLPKPPSASICPLDLCLCVSLSLLLLRSLSRWLPLSSSLCRSLSPPPSS